jgi:hypothetical protein
MDVNRFLTLIAAGLLAAAGCNEAKTPSSPVAGSKSKSDDGDVAANLAKLAPEDRAIAEAQKLCPVTDEPLGSMGVPIKLDIKDQPVFICCKSCEKTAKKDPDETLQKVADLKAKGGKEK